MTYAVPQREENPDEAKGFRLTSRASLISKER